MDCEKKLKKRNTQYKIKKRIEGEFKIDDTQENDESDTLSSSIKIGSVTKSKSKEQTISTNLKNEKDRKTKIVADPKLYEEIHKLKDKA